MPASDSERPRPSQTPGSDLLPDATTAEPPAAARDRASPPTADETPAEAARTPDEYLETPGSHRRPDGAATDVGG